VTVTVSVKVSIVGLDVYEGVIVSVNETVSVVGVTVKYLVLVSVIGLFVHEGVEVVV
jgi:hypothetical protein